MMTVQIHVVKHMCIAIASAVAHAGTNYVQYNL
jgi:hypothetical protein